MRRVCSPRTFIFSHEDLLKLCRPPRRTKLWRNKGYRSPQLYTLLNCRAAANHEHNGWGDDIVYDYLRAIDINHRIAVLYSNKDYGCEWNYDWENKRFATKDNTRFGVNITVYALTH